MVIDAYYADISSALYLRQGEVKIAYFLMCLPPAHQSHFLAPRLRLEILHEVSLIVFTFSTLYTFLFL